MGEREKGFRRERKGWRERQGGRKIETETGVRKRERETWWERERDIGGRKRE